MLLLTKSHVYIGKSAFGITSKVTSPEIDYETAEITGDIGTYNIPVAVKAMTNTITFNSIDIDIFKKISDPLSEINFTIYGALEEFNNETRTSTKQAKLILRGSSQKFAFLGELEKQKTPEISIDLNLSMARFMVEGKELYHIDTINNIWRVNGVDKLQEVKKKLALV